LFAQATSSVPEIQIFDIRLKSDELDESLLRVIDKAIVEAQGSMRE